MPIYEYKCQQCGQSFEEMLSVAEGVGCEINPCPACGERALRRVIGVPAIHTYYSPAHPRHMRGQRMSRGRQK